MIPKTTKGINKYTKKSENSKGKSFILKTEDLLIFIFVKLLSSSHTISRFFTICKIIENYIILIMKLIFLIKNHKK